MSVAIDIAQPGFRVGRVFALALRLLGANILPYALLALIVLAPNLILDLAMNGQDASSINWAHRLINLTLGQLLTALIVYGVFQHLRGLPASPLACLRFGLKRLPALVAVVYFSSLIIALYALLLIVPGIKAATALWVIVPVCVIERLGGDACRERSNLLTDGYRWSIFCIMAIILVLRTLWTIALNTAYGVTHEAINFTYGLSFEYFSGPMPTGYLIADDVGDALTAVLAAVVVTVGYFDLRQIKDGIDLEGIAAIFD